MKILVVSDRPFPPLKNVCLCRDIFTPWVAAAVLLDRFSTTHEMSSDCKTQCAIPNCIIYYSRLFSSLFCSFSSMQDEDSWQCLNFSDGSSLLPLMSGFHIWWTNPVVLQCYSFTRPFMPWCNNCLNCYLL